MCTQLIETRVYSIVSDLFNVPTASLTPTSSGETIQLWDSVGHLNLVLALEGEFGVRFSPEQIDEMVDVGTITKLLTSLNPIETR